MPLLLLTLISGLSSAASPPPEDPGHSASVTVSPLLMLDLELADGSSVFLPEVTYEHRLDDDFSVVGILGAGRLQDAFGRTALIGELGTQGRYYLLGGFDHGLHLALHALLLGVKAKAGVISGMGQGLQIGPLLGYKVAARFGLTFDAQLGATYVAARAHATAPGGSATSTNSNLLPLLRLNLGWSF